jgi:hypothetical protein
MPLSTLFTCSSSWITGSLHMLRTLFLKGDNSLRIAPAILSLLISPITYPALQAFTYFPDVLPVSPGNMLDVAINVWLSMGGNVGIICLHIAAQEFDDKVCILQAMLYHNILRTHNHLFPP